MRTKCGAVAALTSHSNTITLPDWDGLLQFSSSHRQLDEYGRPRGVVSSRKLDISLFGDYRNPEIANAWNDAIMSAPSPWDDPEFVQALARHDIVDTAGCLDARQSVSHGSKSSIFLMEGKY
jgi:hypothetical protein